MTITKTFDIRQANTLTLCDLRGDVLWCAWALGLPWDAKEGSKPRKLPYGASQKLAKSNKPDTWLTWGNAMDLAEILPRLDGLGGVGIYLGPLNDDWVLCGADFDSCLSSDGELAAWAGEILSTLGPVYCEVSPSGTGLKTFMLVRAGEVERLRAALGFVGRYRTQWKFEGVEGTHKAGVEFCLGGWFAVTGDGTAALGVIGMAEIEGFGAACARWFPDRWHGGGSRSGYGGDGEVTDEMIRGVVLPDGLEPLTEDEQGVLEGLPAVRALWGQTFVLGRDKTDSAAVWRMAGMLRAAGLGQEAGVGLLLKCPWVWDWYQEQGDWEGRRQIARAWFRHGTVVVAGLVPFEAASTAAGAGSGGLMAPIAVNDDALALEILSDSSLAHECISDHWHNVRYIKKHKNWLMWGGYKWVKDDVGDVDRLIRRTQVRAALRYPKLTSNLMSAKRHKDIEAVARMDVRVVASVDQWDTDVWKINTPDGVLDLQTGRLGASDRMSYMTKSTAVGPNWSGAHPAWSQFLCDVTQGDRELEAYLGRMAGSFLTGCIHDESLFFLHGSGGNGKGTFVETLSYVLGRDYAKAASIGLFEVSSNQRHSTEIAELKGTRLVTTSETRKEMVWDEAKVNTMTGGGEISARLMRQDNETWIPQYKLLISGNYKPRMGGSVSDATRRRFNLILFLFHGVKDITLKNRLKAEAGAILAWMVRGCQEWRERGLAPPQSVINATTSYLDAEDSRPAWFGECCRRGPGETRQADLFSSWAMWATRMNEEKGQMKSLGEWLEQQGFNSAKNPLNQVVWRGITLSNTAIRGETSPNFGFKPDEDK